MLARYEGAYAATTLIVMGDRSGFAWKDVAGVQLHRHARLRQTEAGQGSAERALHRRGLHPPRLPRPDRPAAEAGGGRAPSSPTSGRRKVKRDDLVDKLIGSPDFVEHWTNKWADLLQVNRKFLGDGGRRGLPRAGSARRSPTTCPTTSSPDHPDRRGSNLDNPPAAYYKVLRDRAPAPWRTRRTFSWPCVGFLATRKQAIRARQRHAAPDRDHLLGRGNYPRLEGDDAIEVRRVDVAQVLEPLLEVGVASAPRGSGSVSQPSVIALRPLKSPCGTSSGRNVMTTSGSYASSPARELGSVVVGAQLEEARLEALRRLLERDIAEIGLLADEREAHARRIWAS